MTTSTAPCPHTDRIDPFLDGNFSPEDTDAFVAHLDACPACERELTLALQLQDALATIDPPLCPDEVFQSALDRIAVLERDRGPIAGPRTARRRWLAGAALMAVAALLIALPVFDRSAAPTYSDADVAAATRDVELAFALLAKASNETSQRVRDNAFGRSAAEINDALYLPR